MKQKTFLRRPEGKTGLAFLFAGLGIASYFVVTSLAAILAFVSTTLGLVVTLVALAAIIYMVLDRRTRTLVSYGYKSIMRWITGIFVTIDPIGILKNYIDTLQENLKKMGKQIGELRGQVRKLKTIISDNEKEIKQNLLIASKAKEQSNQKAMVLSTRKASRLKDSNVKYAALLSKIEILYKILTKMYANSEVLIEDTKDQVKVKEQERKAIRASHSAMKSAMSIINGNADKRAMFDASMESIADDVASKIGEMETFMDMSNDFMSSMDLQNGVFEEQGIKMLEEFDRKSTLMLLGKEDVGSLDLKSDYLIPEKVIQSNSGYEGMF